METVVSYTPWFVLNFGSAVLLFYLFKTGVNLKSMISEKIAGASSPDENNHSFSRVAGIVGAIVLSMFFWAFGNVILHALVNNGAPGQMIQDVWPYFLLGCALFAPYAFNQVKGIFR